LVGIPLNWIIDHVPNHELDEFDVRLIIYCKLFLINVMTSCTSLGLEQIELSSWLFSRRWSWWRSRCQQAFRG